MAQTCGFSITPPDNVAHYYIEEIEVSLLLTDEKKLGTICTTLGLTTPLQMPASAHMLTQYFRRSGYLDEQYLSKKWSIYQQDANEIVIDDVDRVGIIIELECVDAEPLDVVHTILNDDEWKRSVEGTSYLWLEKVKGLHANMKDIDRFKTDSSWNVWHQEQNFYNYISESERFSVNKRIIA